MPGINAIRKISSDLIIAEESCNHKKADTPSAGDFSQKHSDIQPVGSECVDHFFIFQKNSLHLKQANFSSLKRRSIFTSRKILREKLELHSASKKSLNIAKMVEKRFELPVSTHDLAYEKNQTGRLS